MITMVIDHCGVAFFNNNDILRSIGRISFPLYAFMFSEGFRHFKNDSNRVSKHLVRLIILAAVSEFAYDFYKSGLDFSQYLKSQSNILTLLLAYFGLMATEHYKGKPVIIFIIYAITSLLSIIINSNYVLVGVLLVYAFYWYLNLVMEENITPGIIYKQNSDGTPVYCFGKRFLFILLILVIYLPVYFLVSANFSFDNYLYVVRVLSPRYITFFLVAFLIASYNGLLGYSKRWFNVFYYWFYPFHLFIIGLLRLFVG